MPDPLEGVCDLDRRIIRQLVSEALAAGYTISVCDGEAWPVKRSTDADAIISALASTDSDTLRVRESAAPFAPVGQVALVYGNEPGVVVADYSDNEATRALVGNAELAAFNAAYAAGEITAADYLNAIDADPRDLDPRDAARAIEATGRGT